MDAIDLLFMAAARAMDEAGGGRDWQAVVRASTVPEGVVEHLMMTPRFLAIFRVSFADTKTGLEGWHMTLPAQERARKFLAAEAAANAAKPKRIKSTLPKPIERKPLGGRNLLDEKRKG
jgi:hypothetical protein